MRQDETRPMIIIIPTGQVYLAGLGLIYSLVFSPAAIVVRCPSTPYAGNLVMLAVVSESSNIRHIPKEGTLTKA